MQPRLRRAKRQDGLHVMPLVAAPRPGLVSSFDIGPPTPVAPGPARTGVAVIVCTRGRPRSLARFLDSLVTQAPPPDSLLIVDASTDDRAERVVAERTDLPRLARHVGFRRVTFDVGGLTRQRNFGLNEVATDLTVFFDDDVVLEPGCLAEMETLLRSQPGLVGVGAVASNERGRTASTLWRLRRRLGIVDTLEPGRYCRSGMSIPWGLLNSGARSVAADWLPGYAMMWRTAIARELWFNEQFEGYANGEDLEFSLRMARRGWLRVAGRARLQHLRDPEGRPDAYRLGFFGVRNAIAIHRRCLMQRRTRDVAWLTYAFALDTVLQAAALLRQPGPRWRWRFLRGRARALAASFRDERLAAAVVTTPACSRQERS
jgi:glycosyltransferase involved in cell wall biosynthesis